MPDIKITKLELSQDFRDEFVKSLQGKDFILYGGLVTLAHARGFKGMRTELLQAPNKSNDNMCIVRAIVTDENGIEWHGIGDADDTNTNKNIAKHKIRMAETRAKGRALRDALGIDIVMDAELVDPYEKEMITQHQAKAIKRIMNSKGIDKQTVSEISYEMFGIKSSARLLKEQADSLIAELELYDPNEGNAEDADEEDYDEVVEEEVKPKAKKAAFIEDDEEDDDD